MQSYNYIQNIFKSYSIGPALKARLPISFDNNNNSNNSQMEVEHEDVNTQSNKNSPCVDALVLYKVNSIEVWRENPMNNGRIENISEVNVFCNILKLLVIKSSGSSAEKGDILFLLASNMQFRFFRLSTKCEIIILHEGVLRNPDSESITDTTLVFVSQTKSNNNNNHNSDESTSIMIGIYAFYKGINIINAKESRGELQSVSQSMLKKNPAMAKIHSIEALNAKSAAHSIGVLYSDFNESQFNYSQLEVEANHISSNNNEGNQLKFSANKRYCMQVQLTNSVFYAIEIALTGVLYFTSNAVHFYTHADKSTVQLCPFTKPILTHTFTWPNNNQNTDHQLFLATEDSQFESSLFLASLSVANKKIDFKFLGRIPYPSSIIPLSDHHLFITSHDDDSKIIHVSDQFNEQAQTYLSEKLRLPNLSSIYRMKLLESEFNQRLLITSPQKENSLSIFQKGMNLAGRGEFKFASPVKKLLTFSDKHLLISFEASTLLLSLNLNAQTGTPTFKLVLQLARATQNAFQVTETKICLVSPQKIALLDLQSFKIITEFSISGSSTAILSTQVNSTTILVADSANNLNIISINSTTNSITPSAVPLRPTAATCYSAIASSNNLIATALWFSDEVLVQHFNQGNNDVTYPVTIPSGKIVRSLIFHESDKLLIGFSDGLVQLIQFNNQIENDFVIVNQKNMVIGYKPVHFTSINHFTSSSASNPQSIACLSNEVSMLNVRKVDENYSRYQKTYLNVQDVSQIAELQINGTTYFIVAKNSTVQISTIEISQKFHVYDFGKQTSDVTTKPPAVELPLRHQSELVDVIRNISVSVSITQDSDEEIIASKVVLNSLKSQEQLDCLELEGFCVYSLLAFNEFFFIGGSNSTNNSGFLYSYLIDSDSRIQQIDKIEFKIPVIHISKYSQNSIAIVIGHDCLKVFTLAQVDASQYSYLRTNAKFLVESISQSHLSVTAIAMDCNTRGQVLIADRMRGLQLYQEINQKFMAVAKSPFPVFSTSAQFFGDNNILFCDSQSNYLIMRQNEFPEYDMERNKLLVVSSINNGDEIQSTVRRTVSTRDVKDNYITGEGLDQIYFGTKSGWVGVIMSLNQQTNAVLADLQEAILQNHKCPLKFNYHAWKDLKNIPHIRSNKGKIIDGDIISTVLRMSQSELEKTINSMSVIPKPSITEIEQLIENLDLLTF